MQTGTVTSNSFRDPGYDDIEARVAAQLGIPVEALRAVRVGGERTNANRVSPAGARSVYQVMPATRRGLQRQYGVDAWSSPNNAAMAAGHLLQDNFTQAGNWPDAVRMYHGGPDRRHWGPINRAYAARTAPMLAGIGGVTPTDGATIPADEEIRDSYDPRYAESPMDQTPEPAKVPDPGTALQPIAAAAAVPRHRGGLLGLLGRIAMPEPGSLWAGALRDGLVNARQSQTNYQQTQADQAAARETRATAQQAAELTLKQHLTNGTYAVAGNGALHTRPDGSAEIIQAPAQPGENERLIQLWQHTPAGSPLRALIERAIRGAQYSPEVIAEQGAQRERAARAAAGSRAAAAATTAQRHSYAPPAGFVRLPREGQ